MLKSVEDLLRAKAKIYSLPSWEYSGIVFEPWEWLSGLVMYESGGKPDAVRYEPHQDAAGRMDSMSDPDAPGIDNGMSEDDKSYGPMQVMGYNVKALLGIPPKTNVGKYDLLLGWDMGTAFGMAVLVDCLRMRDGDVTRALAVYNGGPSGDKIIDGVMRRQIYIDNVFKRAKAVREGRL